MLVDDEQRRFFKQSEIVLWREKTFNPDEIPSTVKEEEKEEEEEEEEEKAQPVEKKEEEEKEEEEDNDEVVDDIQELVI